MKSVQLSQGRISYSEDGEGPAIVLLHGLLVGGSIWRKVVPRLTSHARVIVPELPLGSHQTPMNTDADLSVDGLVALVAEFLDALELTDVTVVGVDTGGALTQILAARHPDRLSRIVLTSCDTFDNFPPKMFRGLLLAAKLPGGVPILSRALRTKALWRLPMTFGWLAKRPVDEAVMRAWFEPTKRPEIQRDLRNVLANFDPAILPRATEQLRGFDRPVLLAWATEDRFMPLEHARRLQQLLPNARLELIDDSYTFTPEDQPDALANLIASFVSERETARA